MDWQLPTIIAITSSMAIFYGWMRHCHSYWSRRNIFSPPCHWLYGHFRDVFLLRSSPSLVLGDLHKSYPEHRYVGVYVMHKPILLLRDPELIKRVLIKDFRTFPNRYFAAKRKNDVVGSASLFSIDDPPWKYLRTKLTPGFTSVRLKRLFGLMADNAANLKAYMARKVRKDEIISLEVRSIANRYTTDVISSLTFGIKTNCFEEPDTEFYKRSRKIFDTGITRTFELFANYFFPKINDILNKSFLGKETDYLRRIFWESMNEREKTGNKRWDVIDLLIELKNENHDTKSNNFKFEGDYLLSQSAIFFVAGLETSAITMCFTLLAVSTYPDVQRRVRDELREKMIPGQDITHENVAEMVYLNQVVSETLRLYPPAPIIDRMSVDDYKIPGTSVVIEKGTGVYAALKGLHEDPDYHTDPLIFDPERFNETKKQQIKPCTYMPFGEGPRICIGMRTGLLQTLVGLATILSEYEIMPDDNYANEVNKRAMFTSPLDGIHLYFKKNPVFERS